MFSDLDEILKIISFQTGKKEAWIADQINYSRSHLNVLKNKGDSDSSGVIALLETRFEKEIKQFVRRFGKIAASQPSECSLDTLAEKIDSVHSMLFGHVVRSGERYAKEDSKKAGEEMDKINRYAAQFLETAAKKGKLAHSQGKG